MDINIRKAIIENFKSFTTDELHQTIEEAINAKNEKTLPGLGVFFELIWQNSSTKFKEELLNNLCNELTK